MADTPVPDAPADEIDEEAALEAERRRFVAMIEEGLADVEAGRVVTSEELKVILDKARARRRARRQQTPVA